MNLISNNGIRGKRFFTETKFKTFGIALLDQGFFSGFNFIAVVLLARWMTPEGFGAYSYVFSIFLLLAGFHSVLIVEPLNIYGPSRYKNCLTEYLKLIQKVHWILSAILTVAMVLFGVIVWMRGPGSPLASAFVGLGLSQGFI